MSHSLAMRDPILAVLDVKLAPLGFTRKRAVYARPVGESFFHVELERHRKSDPSAPMFTLTLQVRFRREMEALGLEIDPYSGGVVCGWCRPMEPECTAVATEEDARKAAAFLSEFLDSTGLPYLESRLRELESEYPPN